MVSGLIIYRGVDFTIYLALVEEEPEPGGKPWPKPGSSWEAREREADPLPLRRLEMLVLRAADELSVGAAD